MKLEKVEILNYGNILKNSHGILTIRATLVFKTIFGKKKQIEIFPSNEVTEIITKSATFYHCRYIYENGEYLKYDLNCKVNRIIHSKLSYKINEED